MNKKYVISDIQYEFEGSENFDETIYWNNKNGWGDLSSATIFNQKEKDSLTLPIGNHVQWNLLPDTLNYVEYNIIRNALLALKVLALSANDKYLDDLSISALEIFE